ncbi:MAG: hypothetical protein HC927_12120, partial [Deltaproteobacteria bacterium]|nr:hypothetical protein [Deltaproteobacteria bacterium]
PGGSAFAHAGAWFNRPLGYDGDLVILDQRGSGEALPNLDCPEVEAGWFAVLAATMTPQAELELMTEAVQQCHDRLAARGRARRLPYDRVER